VPEGMQAKPGQRYKLGRGSRLIVNGYPVLCLGIERGQALLVVEEPVKPAQLPIDESAVQTDNQPG
jgi:hypothetical protein